jgi:hypothetical protein
MVTVAWNPSTLKLYTGATGKICASCCGTGPVTCPSTYTVSISGVVSCPTPSGGLPFVVGYYYRYGNIVIYNAGYYRCVQANYADQWYSQCWELINFYFGAERTNGTYILTINPNTCNYGYEGGDIKINLLSPLQLGSLSATVHHVLLPSSSAHFFYTFSGVCEDAEPHYCCNTLSNKAGLGYPYSDCMPISLYSDTIGTGGAAKFWPGSFQGWRVNTGYQVGNIVCHLAEKYTCTQNHYSTIANEPGVGSQWSSYWSVSTVC